MATPENLHGSFWRPKQFRPHVPRDADKIPSALRELIRECLFGRAPWPLYISGPPGVGKTCAGLRACDVIMYSVYMTATEVHRESYSDVKHARRDLWQSIENASLLVLDEIGVRAQVSDAAYEVMRETTDLREHQPTIYLSNVPIEKIGELYDGRVVSRMGAGTIVEVKGADRRLS